MRVKTQALKNHPAISSNANSRYWPINDLKKEKKYGYFEQVLHKSEGKKVINISQCQMLE